MNARLMSRVLLPAVLASTGLAVPNAALAQARMVTVPAETVVRLKLEDRLSSRQNRPGDRFAAVMDAADRSGFPVGTRFQGVVTEAEAQTKDRPGMLDMRVQRAYLPDGQKVELDGRLASLADKDVRRTSDGRLESRRGGSGRPDWKWAGYGAAGGAVLGAVLGGEWWKGALLGGLGGAAYAYLNKGKGGRDFRDVDLPRGTEFGMRLDDRVAFGERAAYRYTARRYEEPRYNDRYADRRVDDRRVNDRRVDDRFEDRYADRRVDERDDRRVEDDEDRFERVEDRVLADRREARFSNAVVRVDGRTVRFDNERPRDVNGVVYLPLRDLARAANLRYVHREGEDNFVLDTPSGLLDGRAGDARVFTSGNNTVRLDEAPRVFDGEIFVSAEFLSRAAGMRTSWDRGNMELNVETSR